MVEYSMTAAITHYLLAQGIDPLGTRGSVGGRLIDVAGRPDQLAFSALNDHRPWAVYAAGTDAGGNCRIFYPIVIMRIVAETLKYEFFVAFNREEQTFQLTLNTIIPATKFYLQQMFASGTFNNINATARIRVKPAEAKRRIGFDLPAKVS
jgi:hypothetical protein